MRNEADIKQWPQSEPAGKISYGISATQKNPKILHHRIGGKMRAGADNLGFLQKHDLPEFSWGKTHFLTLRMLQLLADDQRHCYQVRCRVDEAEAMRPKPKVNVGYLAWQDPTLIGGRFSRSVLSHAVQGAY